MIRKLSGSAGETDNTDEIEAENPPYWAHNDVTRKSFTSAKFDVKRQSDSLDRRKVDRVTDTTALISANGSNDTSEDRQPISTKHPILVPGDDVDRMPSPKNWRRSRVRSPWSNSLLTLGVAALALVILLSIVHAFLTRQLDPKGCDMCWSRPIYNKFVDFDTEHTRFATKYSLHLLREGGFDEDPKVRITRNYESHEANEAQVKGVPVLFIPGNAGSYKQSRCLAFEAAQYYHNNIQTNSKALEEGMTSLDFFAVDLNEDFTAFHGQTILDQAEYLNDAVAYILALYHDPRRAQRDPALPDPSSVILVGHSMGGIVARTMLTMSNYQSNSINTIVTMSAPHARAPVSVDAEAVSTYARINDYWRGAYTQKWANDNPLWHVTLVSIAGGGLDTVVPSDFASLESLVPSTHGFTVFTSGIPDVWTGADHIQMTWCAQLMKPIARSLYHVVDARRPSQTKPRAERMRVFKKWYLTGMEDVAEKSLSHQEPHYLIPSDEDTESLTVPTQRLVLRQFERTEKSKPYLMPIPKQIKGDKTFTLLTNRRIEDPADSTKLAVLFCSLHPSQHGQSSTIFSMNLDLSNDISGSTKFACKSAAPDIIRLPASTRMSSQPFDKLEPFSYLQYHLDDLIDFQFVAVIDKATEPIQGWLLAEFNDRAQSIMETRTSLQRLLAFGLHTKLPAERPFMTEVKVPALYSSLLAFKLSLGSQACGEDAELFTPLLRQYLPEPHESKYFVNVKEANISLHGIAPFMPPPLRAHTKDGVSLQFWTDPSCNSSIDVSLSIDVAGSMGKLVMRYRMVFAAFPIVVVALVLRKQFKIYDESGIFITFAESLDLCLRSSLPLLILALTFFAMSVTISNASGSVPTSTGWFGWRENATETAIDFTKNDLLLGSQDPVFWFLVPLFGLISVGACVCINYAALGLTSVFYLPYNYLTTRPAWVRVEDVRYVSLKVQVNACADNRSGRSTAPAFSNSSPRRRIITTCVLLFLVSTFIPYQFAYLDAVLVQLSTCTRALRLVRETVSI